MDLINRQDAIDAINRYADMLMEDMGWNAIHRGDVIVIINSLPSAQQWTPVKDSQPKETGEYLVWWSNAYTSAKDVAIWDEENWWTADTMGLCMTAEVDAWCELPEPYEGVEE